MKPKDDVKLENIYEATLKLTTQVGLAGSTTAVIMQAAGMRPVPAIPIFPVKTELNSRP